MKFQKSPSFHGAGSYSALKPRNLTFKKVVKQVMRDRSNNQFRIQFENMTRRIVQEELRPLLQHFLSSSLWAPIERPRFESSTSRPRYKLRFLNAPPSSIFTGSKIEAEDGSPIAIELVDTTTNTRVVSGQYSSSRVEIVPLNADYMEENWTVDGFKLNILKQREGKRPLLTGDLTLTLKNGVGFMTGEVAYSDNSSWTRSGKFRLGARLSGGGAMEARSKAFGCKDQRGEPYKKHYPPNPSSEIWRLDKIAKDGVLAARFGELGITTVKDFRRWLAMNPTTSYKIFGKVSKKTWEIIVYHAMCCVLDETECYIYNTNTPDTSLVFNSVYELIKVSLSPGGPFQNLDELFNYKPVLDQLKLEAYRNLSHFKAVNGRAFTDHPQRSLQCPQDPRFGINYTGSQHSDFQGYLGSSDTSDSSKSLYLTAAASTIQPEMVSFDNSPLGTFHIDKKFGPLRNRFRVSQLDPLHSELQTAVTRDYTENEKYENAFANHHNHEIFQSWSPGTEHWTKETLEGLCVNVSGTEEDGTYNLHFGNMVGSPRARWCKVKAAFKLREVWKLTTARNRSRERLNKPGLPY